MISSLVLLNKFKIWTFTQIYNKNAKGTLIAVASGG